MIFSVEKPTSERSEQSTAGLLLRQSIKQCQQVHKIAIMTRINHKSK